MNIDQMIRTAREKADRWAWEASVDGGAWGEHAVRMADEWEDVAERLNKIKETRSPGHGRV